MSLPDLSARATSPGDRSQMSDLHLPSSRYVLDTKARLPLADNVERL